MSAHRASKALRHPDADTRHARIGQDLVVYRLRRSTRRTIGFLIDAGGLSVTAPHRVALADIDRAIADKQRWIARKLVEWREHAERRERAAVRWEHGGTLRLLGAPLALAVDNGCADAHGAPARGHIVREDGVLRIRTRGAPSAEALQRAVQHWLKAQARATFAQRLAAFERDHAVAPTRWALSSARTRWGSCSAAGTIRLNWRLVHFPPAIVDYVIAHELAHLAELNHGPRFWQRVAELYPDWQAARRWLRTHANEAAVA